MPNRKRLALFAILVSVIFTVNCNTVMDLFSGAVYESQYVPTEEDLIDTRWIIVYHAPNEGDREYYLIFHENGVLENTHPNDKTHDNDTWALEGSEIVIRFNDGYAVYRGTFSDRDAMAGTATNKVGESWEWTASRQK
jgi:hypothetical protein